MGTIRVNVLNTKNYKEEDGVVHEVFGWNGLSNTFVLTCGERQRDDYRPEGWTAEPITCVVCLGKAS